MNVRFGYASTFTDAVCPAFTFPMSLSLTSVQSYTWPRSAIVSSVVPPPTVFVAELMTCPSDTSFSITVPAIGARIVTSSSAIFA